MKGGKKCSNWGGLGGWRSPGHRQYSHLIERICHSFVRSFVRSLGVAVGRWQSFDVPSAYRQR